MVCHTRGVDGQGLGCSILPAGITAGNSISGVGGRVNITSPWLPRCGCVTMLKSPNKATAVKQWEQRWIKNCLCGGLWRRVPLSCP